MPPAESPTGPPPTSGGPHPTAGPLSPVRAVVIGLLLGMISAAAGITVGAITLPPSDELQRAAVEEIGLDPGLLDNPLIAPFVDELTERVEDRLVAEARRSMVLAVTTSTLVAVGGLAAVALVSRRRRSATTRDDARHML